MQIHRASVTAVAEWEPRFEVGARYLVFVDKLRDRAEGIWAYKVGPKELLESTWDAFYTHGAHDSVHGMPLSAARDALIKGW